MTIDHFKYKEPNYLSYSLEDFSFSSHYFKHPTFFTFHLLFTIHSRSYDESLVQLSHQYQIDQPITTTFFYRRCISSLHSLPCLGSIALLSPIFATRMANAALANAAKSTAQLMGRHTAGAMVSRWIVLLRRPPRPIRGIKRYPMDRIEEVFRKCCYIGN